MSEALVLSNSKANTYRRCQKRYHFKYGLRLKKKDRALPLFRGDWLHQLLMVHHDGHDWKLRHAMLKAQNWDNLFDEEKEELGGNLPEEVMRLMKGYLAYYRAEDKNWHTVDTEVDETVELPNGMLVRIIIDRIAEYLPDHSLWVWDYKSVSRFYPEDFLLLDAQLALYFWAADTRLGYRNLVGAVLDELITKPPTLPKFLDKSQRFEMRKNIHCDAYTYYACIKQADQDPRLYANFLRYLQTKHPDWWRRTRLPRDKAMVTRVVREMMDTGEDILTTEQRGRYTRSSRKECQFDCDFLVPCMAQLQGASIKDIIRTNYQRSKRPDEEDLKRLWPIQQRQAVK